MSKTFSTNMSFDLIEYIQDLPNVEIAAQAMQSVAFRIDVLIQSNARAIFKQLRKEEQESLPMAERTADKLAEIEAAFAEMKAADKAFHETGMNRSGFVRIIKELLAMRETANESAQSLTAMTVDWKGDPRKFEPTDLNDLFMMRPNMRVTDLEKQRINATAQLMKEHGLAGNLTVDELVALDVERRKNELERMADTLESQAHIVQNFFILAEREAMDDVASDFWLMDLGTQRVLIEAARNAIVREIDRAKSNRKLDSMTFMQVVGLGMQAVKKLDEVLRSPKFVQRQIEDSVVEK